MKHKKTELSETMGRRIIEIQKDLGISVKEMAEKIGVSEETIRSYKRGDSLIGTEICIRMIENLHVNPEYLFTGDDSKGYTFSTYYNLKEDDSNALERHLNNYLEISLGLPEERRKESLKLLLKAGVQLIK